eukprot:16065750-Heterocapsa_arctica.AAC.1
MGSAGRRRRERSTEGASDRSGATARCQDDTGWGGANGMVHRAVHAIELHEQGYGGWLEAGPGWREVPMGHQNCYLYQAGVDGQKDLSSDYEHE